MTDDLPNSFMIVVLTSLGGTPWTLPLSPCLSPRAPVWQVDAVFVSVTSFLKAGRSAVQTTAHDCCTIPALSHQHYPPSISPG